MQSSLSANPVGQRFSQIYASYRDRLLALDGSQSDQEETAGDVWVRSSNSAELWQPEPGDSQVRRGALLQQSEYETKLRLTGVSDSDGIHKRKLEFTESEYWLTLTGVDETRRPGQPDQWRIESLHYCPSTAELSSELGSKTADGAYRVESREGTSLLNELLDQFQLA